jgi:tight adherence protein C
MSASAVLPLLASASVVAVAWSRRPMGRPRRPEGAPSPRRSRPPRRVVVVLAGSLVCACAVIHPVLGVVAGVGVGTRLVAGRRSAGRDARRAVVDELPEVVDLLALAVSAGLSVPLAVGVVADRGHGAVATELGRALESASRGGSLADALDEIVDALGDDVRGVVRAVSGSLRDGTALEPVLDRLAVEVRVARRRAAEERARRLPVQLLFPLVLCILPAFGLLTVVPLLAGSLTGLPW